MTTEQNDIAAALSRVLDPLQDPGARLVPGEGNPRARLAIVGEAPGEEEDAAGRPFVGRAGQLLDKWLQAAGLTRADLWVSNVVKFRPTVDQGGVLKNRAPRVGEIRQFLPALLAELRLIQPRVVVCMGATAAKALIGKDFRLSEQRGEWFPGPEGSAALATFHPAFVLRQVGEDRARIEQLVIGDLTRAAERLREGA